MGAIKYNFPNLPHNPTDVDVAAAKVAVAGRQFDPNGQPIPAFAHALIVLEARQAYTGIYEDLLRLGHGMPAIPADSILRDQLVEHLRRRVGDLVAAEVRNDPDDIYDDTLVAAATDGDAAAAGLLAELINQELAWDESTTEPGEWTTRPASHQDHRAGVVSHPIGRALAGFPHGPTALTADDIMGALKGKS